MAKRYRVELTPRAEHDIESFRVLIAQDKPRAAAKWVRDIDRQIRSLSLMPLRYEVIPEAEAVKKEYRHIIYGNYRVIYRIAENRVVVIRVVHAARLVTESMLEHD